MATLVWEATPPEPRLLGGGYEFERLQQATLQQTTLQQTTLQQTTMAGQPVTWVERVQLFRSMTLAQRQEKQLEQRLARAQETLSQLTPPPARGRRAYQDEATLQDAVTEVLKQHQVLGLLQVNWTYQETCRKRYVGRPGPQRAFRIERKRRYEIAQVLRNEEAIAHQKHRLGWQLYVTNLPKHPMTLEACVRHYREGVCVEQDFHQLKDKPLGIRPLYVRCEDQLVGLTHLLTLGLRLLTLIKMQVRRAKGEAWEALVPGQPKRATDRPTAKRMLQAFVRDEITLTRLQIGEHVFWHLTPLSPLLERILAYLGLSVTWYTRLIQNST